MIGKLLVVGLILFSLVDVLYIADKEDIVVEAVEDVFQGPVPLGYDLEYFRKTGETILEAEE